MCDNSSDGPAELSPDSTSFVPCQRCALCPASGEVHGRIRIFSSDRSTSMTLHSLRIALVAATVALPGLALAGPASAQEQKPPATKPATGAKPVAAGASTPTPLGQFGDWQAFQLGSAKSKSCFAISNPKERKPAGLNR